MLILFQDLILAPVILVETAHVLNLKKGTHVTVQLASQEGIVTKVAHQALFWFCQSWTLSYHRTGRPFRLHRLHRSKKLTRFKPRERAASLKRCFEKLHHWKIVVFVNSCYLVCYLTLLFSTVNWCNYHYESTEVYPH